MTIGLAQSLLSLCQISICWSMVNGLSDFPFLLADIPVSSFLFFYYPCVNKRLWVLNNLVWTIKDDFNWGNPIGSWMLMGKRMNWTNLSSARESSIQQIGITRLAIILSVFALPSNCKAWRWLLAFSQSIRNFLNSTPPKLALLSVQIFTGTRLWWKTNGRYIDDAPNSRFFWNNTRLRIAFH